MSRLADLHYPEIQEATRLFESMPKVDECVRASGNITSRAALAQDASILDGTVQQRVERLLNALADYHAHVSRLRKDMYENVSAIRRYSERPLADAALEIKRTRLNVERRLANVHQACRQTQRRLTGFRQIRGTQSLRFTQQMLLALDSIEDRLARELRRIDANKLDMHRFHEQFRARPPSDWLEGHRQLQELQDQLRESPSESPPVRRLRGDPDR